jgi:hypothetical protein
MGSDNIQVYLSPGLQPFPRPGAHEFFDAFVRGAPAGGKKGIAVKY